MRARLTLAVLAAAWLALAAGIAGREGGPAPELPPAAAAGAARGEAEGPRAAPARPARILAHYGFGEGGFRPFAALEFGGPAVGAALPGAVVRAGEGTVELRCADGTALSYEGLERVCVGPGRPVEKGELLGYAGGPVVLRAARGGRALDPVALLWPDLSRFAEEAGAVEGARRRLAEAPRRAAPEKAAGAPACPAALEPLFEAAARESGLDPRLLKAVAAVESGFDPRAVSPKGALGLMQLMPETAERLGVSNPFDPAQSARAGARHLRGLLDRFGGDLELALAAYNAGAGAVEEHGGVPPFPETREYVRRVLAVLSRAPGR